MSNHDAGRQVGSIVALAIDLFDEDKITLDIALQIITAAVKSVYYCDGNEYEAYECVEAYRCVRCLKCPDEKEYLYDYVDVANEIEVECSPGKQLGTNTNLPDRSLWYNVCKDCLIKMFAAAGLTDKQKERLTQFIEQATETTDGIVLCHGYRRETVYTDKD